MSAWYLGISAEIEPTQIELIRRMPSWKKFAAVGAGGASAEREAGLAGGVEQDDDGFLRTN